MKKLISLILAGSLFFTASGVDRVFAADVPSTDHPISDSRFFTDQAVVQRLTSAHFARPSLGMLYRRMRPASETEIPDRTRKILQAFLDRSQKPSGIQHAVAILAAADLVFQLITTFTTGHMDSAHIQRACGNVALLVHPSVRWIKVIILYMRIIKESTYRGWHSGGTVAYFPGTRADGGPSVSAGILARVKNFKRTDLTWLMVGSIVFFSIVYQLFRLVTFQGLSLDAIRKLHGHVRLTTSSAPTLKESQVLRFLKPAKKWVTRVIGGVLSLKKVRVEDTIGHNGDFDDWELFPDAANPQDRVVGQDEMAYWLKDVFHVHGPMRRKIIDALRSLVSRLSSPWSAFDKVRKMLSWIAQLLLRLADPTIGNDSWKFSGLFHLLHTQGQWEASVNYAFHTTGDRNLRFPILSPKELASLTAVFEKAYLTLQPGFFAGGIASLKDIPAERRQLLIEAITPLLPAKASDSKFVQTAVDSYFDNDLINAERLALKRATGTFGFVGSSSLEPDRYVAHSNGQEIYVAFSADWKTATIVSSGDAIKLEEFDYRFPLKDGESVEVAMDESGVYLNVYDDSHIKEEPWNAHPVRLSDEVVNGRLESLHGKKITPLPQRHGRSIVLKDNASLAGLVKKIRESFYTEAIAKKLGKKEGDNDKVAAEFSRILFAIGTARLIENAMGIPSDHILIREELRLESERLGSELSARTITDDQFFDDVRATAQKLLLLVKRRDAIETELLGGLSPSVNHGFQNIIREHSNDLFTRSYRSALDPGAIPGAAKKIKTLWTAQEEAKEKLERRLVSRTGPPANWEDLIQDIEAESGAFWRKLSPEVSSPEKLATTERTVAEKIYEMSYHADPQDRLPLDVAVRKAFESAIREMSPSKPAKGIDILVYGVDSSLWVLEQIMQDFGKLFRDAGGGFSMARESSNKVYERLSDQENRKDYQWTVAGGVANRNTLFLAGCNSGVTFSTLNATKKLVKRQKAESRRLKKLLGRDVPNPKRIFIITGGKDSPLGRVIGEDYTDDAQSTNRIFVTYTPSPESEARQTTVVAQHTLMTELFMLRIPADMRRAFPGIDPFGMRLEMADIRRVERRQDELWQFRIPKVTGVDAQGNPAPGAVSLALRIIAFKLAMRIFDPWVRGGISSLYIAWTVGLHHPTIGHYLYRWLLYGHFHWNVLVTTINVAFDKFPLESITAWTDVAVYIMGFGLLFVYISRALTGRPLMGRVTNPKILIGDIPHVWQPVKRFLEKLFGLGYAGLTPNVVGGNPADHLIMREDANRGDQLHLGLPDDRKPIFVKRLWAVLKTGKQYRGAKSLGGNVEATTLGFDARYNNQFNAGMNLPIGAILPEAPEKRERVLQLIEEARFDSLVRMIAFFTIYGRTAWIVTLGGRLWRIYRSKGGAGAQTTPTPFYGTSALWNIPLNKGWIRPAALPYIAFLEELFFSGLLIALPLHFIGDHELAKWAAYGLVPAVAILFGILHPRLWKVNKEGEVSDGGATNLRQRAGFAVLALVFQAGYLVGNISSDMSFLFALMMHAGFNLISHHFIGFLAASADSKKPTNPPFRVRSIPTNASAEVTPEEPIAPLRIRSIPTPVNNTSPEKPIAPIAQAMPPPFLVRSLPSPSVARENPAKKHEESFLKSWPILILAVAVVLALGLGAVLLMSDMSLDHWIHDLSVWLHHFGWAWAALPGGVSLALVFPGRRIFSSRLAQAA